MMTNKLKRALSLMLAFCMTLGLVTTGALAEAEPEPAEDVQVEQAVPACAELAGCTGETHVEGCPLYAAPENAADDELDPSVGGSPEGTSGDQAPLTTDEPDDSAEETEAGVYYAKWKVAPPAIKVVASGICGYPTLADVTWTLTEDGVMTLSGKGGTKTYPSPDSARSWMKYKDQIISVIVEDGITSIGGWMFNNCSEIKSVQLPGIVTSLGKYAFGGCSLLESIEIPNVKYLDDNVFDGCVNLKTIGAKSLWTIGSGTFRNCSSLQETYLTAQVTKIGAGAYYGCASLKSAVIPEGIKEVGQDTFKGCSSLTEIVIPNSVVKIGSGAFANCTSLAQVTLPPDLVDLCGGTFEGCTSLASIEIPSKVEDIGTKAFMGCTSLQSVVIHAPIGTIYADAFNGCTALESIVIPASVTQIRPRAFDNTKLKYAIVDGTTLATLDDTGNWEPSKGKYLPTSPAICYAAGTVTELPVLENHILAVLNGGSIVDGEPVLEGKALDGWYTSADFTGDKVEALTAPGVYYAKWVCEHTWGEGKVTQEATCTTAGVRTYTCTLCGETKTEEIAVKGHTMTHVEAKAATTDAEGNIEYWHCTACDKYFRDVQATQEITLTPPGV